MSIRVALIGDSHLACLAQAAQSEDFESLRPTFFAYILHRLRNLRVGEGCLVPGDRELRRILKATSGGAEKIDPEQYDLFVLMGMEFEFPFRSLKDQFYSRAVTEQTLRDQASRSLAYKTLLKLRQVTDKPVWILHNPLVDPSRSQRRPEVLTYDRFLEIAREIFQPLDASVLPQPEETRVDDHFSRPELSRSAISLNHETGAPNPIGADAHHKDEAFGRSVLRDLAKRLEASNGNTWRPRRLGQVHERDGDELLLLLREAGDGVRLNMTAAAIWEHCDGLRTVSQLLVELSQLFGTSEDALRSDLDAALESLVEAGAIEPENPPMHPLINVNEGHLGGYGRASASLPGWEHGDPQTWEPELWQWAVETFAAGSVLDVGCGEAHSTRYLHDLGCRVLGIDGSVQAKAASALPEHHVLHDFVEGPFVPEGEFDLVWSCEFVEHVEERYVDHFLATFAVARKALLMTFGELGQPGWHHVNCQPVSYWVEKIEGLGFRFDSELTERGRDIAQGMHFGRKGLLFVR